MNKTFHYLLINQILFLCCVAFAVLYVEVNSRREHENWVSEKISRSAFHEKHITEYSKPSHPKEAVIVVAKCLDDELASANDQLATYWARLCKCVLWVGACCILANAIQLTLIIFLYKQWRNARGTVSGITS